MLDTDTKRRIDTARDILVGKVPDPKSQVEQITIALIYKFMDDMDAEAEELGGKRKFFTKEFARYGWAKLMQAGIGGHEMLGLYAEGITKMPENPGIPPLFRDIFKNAYLPYRDPETLKAFLKIIDEFSYDHSERLGDAFEYLLSVLGSQGDAGQFRTPRHIIDFIVEILDPKKDETVLDPACGTAGFLISSYKHILRANIDAKGHSKLTPDDRGRLAKNFKGYDISPDMVRLSLVNLYLHGFTDPHIFEYDTLTSEERWNEFADVILANPPFMSPKGGIKPHKRFSIQAKRSEVLFVDYMAEHLRPTGRAGIIVPEGIIFQSQDAYKTLRKMLVENSLIAVVSLPAGCFNPYSGVKTSILLLDKALARQSGTIAFFKVENDGFGLGAQRRAIEKNDLPQVQGELETYLHGLRTGGFRASDGGGAKGPSVSAKGATPSQPGATPQEKPIQFSAKGAALSQPGATPQENAIQHGKGLKARPIPRTDDGSGFQPSGDGGNGLPGALPQAGMECAFGAPLATGLIVPKEKIAANGDYNLSGERYREGAVSNSSFPMVELGEVCELVRGVVFSKDDEVPEGGVQVLRANNINKDRYELNLDDIKRVSPKADFSDEKKLRKDDIFICLASGSKEHVGKVALIAEDTDFYFGGFMGAIRVKLGRLHPGYLLKQLTTGHFNGFLREQIAGANINNLSGGILYRFKIPLLPLEVQKEIVAEIEGYQKVINGARAVLDHYRPHIHTDPDWPMVHLADICETITDGDHQPPPKASQGIPFVTITNIDDDHQLDFTKTFFVPESYYLNLNASRKPRGGDILYTVTGSYGIPVLVPDNIRFCFQRHIALIRTGPQLLNRFLLSLLASPFMLQQGHEAATGVAQKTVSLNSLRSFQIPLPPLNTQQAIVAEIEAEQALVAANRELITRFERKIQDTLARVWGEESDSANGAPSSQPGATPQERSPQRS